MMPCKLTTEAANRIVAHLKIGNGRETAAAVVGVDPRTFRRWMTRGAFGEEPFASFVAQCMEAEAAAEARYVGVLFQAARTDWRAAAWVLARKYPERWGDRVQLKIEEGLQQLLNVAETTLAAEEFGKLLLALSDDRSSVDLPAGRQDPPSGNADD